MKKILPSSVSGSEVSLGPDILRFCDLDAKKVKKKIPLIIIIPIYTGQFYLSAEVEESLHNSDHLPCKENKDIFSGETGQIFSYHYARTFLRLF